MTSQGRAKYGSSQMAPNPAFSLALSISWTASDLLSLVKHVDGALPAVSSPGVRPRLTQPAPEVPTKYRNIIVLTLQKNRNTNRGAGLCNSFRATVGRL